MERHFNKESEKLRYYFSCTNDHYIYSPILVSLEVGKLGYTELLPLTNLYAKVGKEH